MKPIYFFLVLALTLSGCAKTPASPPPIAVTGTNLPLKLTPTLTSIPPTPTFNLIPTSTSTPTLTPTITPSPTPTITPIPERTGVIYFTADREGSFDIFKLDLSTGVEQRVTTDAYTDEYFPHLSPDGEWLTYWSLNPNNKSVHSLEILNLADSKKRFGGATSVDKALGWSTWSPDSQEIAFVLYTFDILVLTTSQSEPMRALLFTPDTEYYPAWAPDGKTIAYVRMEDEQAKIYLIGSDGKNNRALFKDDQIGYSPAWSPDSKMIAFISGDETESQVYVINADGSDVRQLTSGPGIRDDPTWSPYGGWIAFWSDQDGDSEIFAMMLDGSGLTQLTENEFMDENPSWAIGATQSSASQRASEAVATEPPAATNVQPPNESISLPKLITDTLGIKMAMVPAGEFQMGSEESSYATPVHTVFLDAYYIDLYEVTNSLYTACVEAGACIKPDPRRSSTRQNYYVEQKYDDYPVINIGWKEARTYCQWRGGDLPTEAQWEKAARGGLEGKFYPWGDQAPTCQAGAANGAHYQYCDPDDTVKVGSFAANGYGLFDMAGNVSEFVLDWFGPYSDARVENPMGPSRGEEYVIRGGGWNWNEASLRVADRNVWYPSTILGLGDDVTGFRCVRSP